MTEKQRLMCVLRDALADIGKPYADVAAEIGVERKAVGRWVRGENQPKAAYLVRLMMLTSDPEGYMKRLVAQ